MSQRDDGTFTRVLIGLCMVLVTIWCERIVRHLKYIEGVVCYTAPATTDSLPRDVPRIRASDLPPGCENVPR